MKTYAKLVDGALATTCAADDQTELIAQIAADGFKLYDDSVQQPDLGPFQEARPAYEEDADRISLRWEIVENSPAKIEAEIARLQSELSVSDYQIIKSYEYTIAGEQPPYDIKALHELRQGLRNRIEELEGLSV